MLSMLRATRSFHGSVAGEEDDHDHDHDDLDDDPDVGAIQQNPTMTNSQFPLWENAGEVSPAISTLQISMQICKLIFAFDICRGS